MKLYVVVVCLLMGLSAFAQGRIDPYSSVALPATNAVRAAVHQSLDESREHKDSPRINSSTLIAALEMYAAKHPQAFKTRLELLREDQTYRNGTKTEAELRRPALMMTASLGETAEVKSYIDLAVKGRSNYVGFLSEHYAEPDSNNTLLDKEKEATHSRMLTLHDIPTDQKSGVHSGQVLVQLKGKTDARIQMYRGSAHAAALREISYLERTYHANEIPQKCKCSMQWGIADEIRDQYDRLTLIRDLLEGKSSSNPASSEDLFAMFKVLQSLAASKLANVHVDAGLDEAKREQYRSQIQKAELQKQMQTTLSQTGVIRLNTDSIAPVRLIVPSTSKGKQ